MSNYDLDFSKSKRKTATAVFVSALLALVIAATVILIVINMRETSGPDTPKALAAPGIDVVSDQIDDVSVGYKITFNVIAKNNDDIEDVQFEYRWFIDVNDDFSNTIPGTDDYTRIIVPVLTDYRGSSFTVTSRVRAFFIQEDRVRLESPWIRKDITINVNDSDFDTEIDYSVESEHSAGWWLNKHVSDVESENNYELDENGKAATLQPGAAFIELNQFMVGAKKLEVELSENPLKQDGDFVSLILHFNGGDGSYDQETGGWNSEIILQLAKWEGEFFARVHDKRTLDNGEDAWVDAQSIAEDHWSIKLENIADNFVIGFEKRDNQIVISGAGLEYAGVPYGFDGQELDLAAFRSFYLLDKTSAEDDLQSYSNTSIKVSNLKMIR